MKPWMTCLQCSALLFAAFSASAQVTVESLLEEMTDLGRLAELPDPWYTTRQFSSHDRASTDPAVQTDENWYANLDRGHHLGMETSDLGNQHVLMDAQGPGAVVRFWSANPDDAGMLRVYLDDAYEPVIEMPLRDFLGGGSSAAPEGVGGVRGRGWNAYLPIPFAKRCKITCSEPDFYYIINYRAYAEGTEVVTLTPNTLAKSAEAIQAAGAKLRDIQHPAAQLEPKPLGPGEIWEERVGKGAPGVITTLAAQVNADDMETALRGLVLSIAFDGTETVRAPLGDFFGTAPGANAFKSLPLAVEGDILQSRWVMPFQEHADIRVENLSGAQADVAISWTGEAGYAWSDRSLYFHAKWRAEADIPTRPRRDWNYADLNGQGRFVGTMLHVANPVKAWWGEGDEKIYVDNEAFPTWFGTGSEDFFGYAWCDNHTFTHAYHNQPRVDGPGNFGHTCVSRFLIMDDIPFAERLKFDMEVWHWEDTRVTQAATSYWYGRPGMRDNFEPIAAASLTIPPLPEPPVQFVAPGAIEGEKMTVKRASGGRAENQSNDMWPWSRGEQLWWQHAAPGDTLLVSFDVPEFGRYRVSGVFTKAPDYGIAAISVNDAAPVAPVDFYHTEVAVTEPVNLGTHDLKQDGNTLTVEITGTNASASPASHMVGIDYLLLERVEEEAPAEEPAAETTPAPAAE